MPNKDIIDNAYQSIFNALSGYSKNVSNSYRGGVLELSKRLDDNVRIDNYGREIGKGDFLSMIKDGEGELANWKTDTRMQMIRDIEIVVDQFPELDLAADTALEAMCDGDVVNGGMKFNIVSKNENIPAVSMVEKLEGKYRIKYHLRNTVYRNTLKHGEYYVLIKRVSQILDYAANNKHEMQESVSLFEAITQETKRAKQESRPDKNDKQLKFLYESAEHILNDGKTDISYDSKKLVNAIMDNISVNHSYEELLLQEIGDEGIDILAKDHGFNTIHSDNMFENIVDGFSTYQDGSEKFDKFKGCYLKWMNATQMLPIRVGGIEIGYYYIHYANTNISNKTSFANGIVDLSQTTTLSTSRDFMTQLSNLIVSNLDVKFAQNNVDMLNEITSILMENQFRKKSVSFTFIPKEDVVPFRINVDVEGNGNSMFSRSLFNARLYTMMLMTNIITLLNNRPSRTYKVKRDPRTNNIASTIQRFKEKIYSKRIGVDDVWSYNGAMNKIGSPNDKVIPVDADGTAPYSVEYDEGANIPLNTELMEMSKKAAITLTGIPNAVINQQDEIEYSKLAQMAQLKLLDFVKNLKIDINASTTELYRRLFQLEFGLSLEDTSAISVLIPDVRSNDINIISEMMQTFSTIFEQLQTVLLTPDQATTPEGKPSNAVKNLKYEMMKLMIPSIDYPTIEKIRDHVLMQTTADELNDQMASFSDFADDDESIINDAQNG